MVTRSRKDVCFLAASTQNPPSVPPPHPTSWKPANKVPLCVEKAKRTGCCAAVETASCNNRRPKALNNMEGFAEEGTNTLWLVGHSSNSNTGNRL